jgi:hypothetical protein
VAHIFFLIGFRNRVSVALDWLWAYITFERGARLITSSPAAEEPVEAGASTPDRNKQSGGEFLKTHNQRQGGCHPRNP